MDQFKSYRTAAGRNMRIAVWDSVKETDANEKNWMMRRDWGSTFWWDRGSWDFSDECVKYRSCEVKWSSKWSRTLGLGPWTLEIALLLLDRNTISFWIENNEHNNRRFQISLVSSAYNASTNLTGFMSVANYRWRLVRRTSVTSSLSLIISNLQVLTLLAWSMIENNRLQTRER